VLKFVTATMTMTNSRLRANYCISCSQWFNVI